MGFWNETEGWSLISYIPSDVDQFFDNWTEVLVKYATFAESKNIKTFDVAYEMMQLTGDYQEKWEQLIQSVRNVYHGEISANFQNPDEGVNATFLDQPDVVQTSVFYRHTDKFDPTVQELVDSWTETVDGINIVDKLYQLHLISGGKKILIGDIAFVSTDGANTNFNSINGLTQVVDEQEQADQFEAFFRVFSNQEDWIMGVTFLTWFPFDSSKSNEYTSWSWEIGPLGRGINQELV